MSLIDSPSTIDDHLVCCALPAACVQSMLGELLQCVEGAGACVILKCDLKDPCSIQH